MNANNEGLAGAHDDDALGALAVFLAAALEEGSTALVIINLAARKGVPLARNEEAGGGDGAEVVAREERGHLSGLLVKHLEARTGCSVAQTKTPVNDCNAHSKCTQHAPQRTCPLAAVMPVDRGVLRARDHRKRVSGRADNARDVRTPDAERTIKPAARSWSSMYDCHDIMR